MHRAPSDVRTPPSLGAEGGAAETTKIAQHLFDTTNTAEVQGRPAGTFHHEHQSHLVEVLAAKSGILGRHISHRETDDAYPCIAKITPTLRVINCKDDMQWIVQVLQGDQWRGVSFCRTREALIRDVRRRLGASDPLHVLQSLPAHHDEAAP